MAILDEILCLLNARFNGHFGEVMSRTREVLGVRQDVSKLADNSTW